MPACLHALSSITSLFAMPAVCDMAAFAPALVLPPCTSISAWYFFAVSISFLPFFTFSRYSPITSLLSSLKYSIRSDSSISSLLPMLTILFTLVISCRMASMMSAPIPPLCITYDIAPGLSNTSSYMPGIMPKNSRICCAHSVFPDSSALKSGYRMRARNR